MWWNRVCSVTNCPLHFPMQWITNLIKFISAVWCYQELHVFDDMLGCVGLSTINNHSRHWTSKKTKFEPLHPHSNLYMPGEVIWAYFGNSCHSRRQSLLWQGSLGMELLQLAGRDRLKLQLWLGLLGFPQAQLWLLWLFTVYPHKWVGLVWGILIKP